jgi:diguanylate cyclase (GGDEF)-like protein
VTLAVPGDSGWVGLGPFRHLLSVALAVVRDDGELVECNAGFRRLLGSRGAAQASNVAGFFVLPPFEQLAGTVAEPGQPVHRGVLNVGTREHACGPLVGTVHREGRHLIVAAEFDVAEMELLNAQVVELNEQLADTQRQLARKERHLRELTLTDPLTGLANRRRLDAFMQSELLRARRGGAPLAAVMADLDHFKRINDSHGHAFGDEMLRRFASLLRDGVRQGDLAARLGGEEFVVVLPMTDLAGALRCAEQLRCGIAAMRPPGLTEPLTASFGVAQHRAGDSIDELLRHADRALYAAKRGGRNRVVADPPDSVALGLQQTC